MSTNCNAEIAKDLTPSAPGNSGRFVETLMEVEGMLQGHTRNFEEAKKPVWTLKQNLGNMQTEHRKIVEHVDSLKHEFNDKDKLAKTSLANTKSKNGANNLPTRVPYLEEFPPVQSATEPLLRSARYQEPLSPSKVDNKTLESRAFRRSPMKLYSEAINPIELLFPQQSKESISEELIDENETSESQTPAATEPSKKLESGEYNCDRQILETQFFQGLVFDESPPLQLSGDERSLQEEPSSSSNTNMPNPETPTKLTKQQVLKFKAQAKKQEAEDAKQHELASVKKHIQKALKVYIRRSDILRKNLDFEALDKKVFDKFLSDRFDHFHKAEDEFMSMFYTVLQENYAPCVAQDMFIHHQRLSFYQSHDIFVDFEKLYFRFVTGVVHPDTVRLTENFSKSQLSEFGKCFLTLLKPKGFCLQQLPRETFDQSMERTLNKYIERQRVLREMNMESLDPATMDSAQITLVKQHQVFHNSPLKWENAKAKEFFIQKATLMRTSAPFVADIFTYLSTKVDDVLVIDAMCLNTAFLNPSKHNAFRNEYVMILIQSC